jgi:hypothetical protein
MFCEKIAQWQRKIAQKVAQPFFAKFSAYLLYDGVFYVFYANIKWNWTFQTSFEHKKLRKNYAFNANRFWKLPFDCLFVCLFVRHTGRQTNLNPGRGYPFSKLRFNHVHSENKLSGLRNWVKAFRLLENGLEAHWRAPRIWQWIGKCK